MEFSGRLTAFPIGELLQWARNERRSGTVVVRGGLRQKRISLRQGVVAGCVSENPEELYSRYLLVNGHLDPQALVAALTYANRNEKRLGAALRDLKLLSEDELRSTLGQHIQDSVCSVFLWTDGVFYFEGKELEIEDPPPAPIDTFGLVMEGSRWLDEYRRICATFVHERVRLARGPEWPGRGLGAAQARILEGMARTEALAELYRRHKGSYFRFLEAVFDLTQRRILEIAGWAALEAGEAAEASLFPEPERDDAVLVSDSSLLLPLATVERLVPVLVGGEGGDPTSEELRRIRREVDGVKSLGRLCGGEGPPSARRWELLLGELRRGRLALLPAPLLQLEQDADQRREPPAKRWWRRLTPLL